MCLNFTFILVQKIPDTHMKKEKQWNCPCTLRFWLHFLFTAQWPQKDNVTMKPEDVTGWVPEVKHGTLHEQPANQREET